jgi:hypothetical protein
MMALDKERWPGGKMAGYILWIGERWAEWKAAHPELAPPRGSDWVLTREDQAMFDTWLNSLPLNPGA